MVALPCALLMLAGAGSMTGCGSLPLRGQSFLPPIFRTSFGASPPALAAEKSAGQPFRPGRPSGTPGPAELVERSLRSRGVRFGTDGTPTALYAYVRFSHELVPPAHARPGDLLFFDLEGEGCGDHVGLVEAVDDEGRITFKESRAGQIRRSFVAPAAPSVRRSNDGRILNTFLRSKRIDDPPDARYFAGEMLCAVGRVRGRK
jgi:hypothetical protein